MIGRRLVEIVIVAALIWYFLSLKFFLGLAAGFILAGEVGWSVWRKKSS